jgi:hypothetical protein
MKTNHNSDPLDQQIDTLLASRPVKPSDDFAARVLTASAETALAEDSSSKTKRLFGPLIKFTLPLAAAIAVTISLLPVNYDSVAPTGSTESATISIDELQEIFLLEESLSSFANVSATEVGSVDLLSILDALYLEI